MVPNDASTPTLYSTNAAPDEAFRPPLGFGRDITRTPSPTPSEQRALADDGKPSFKKLFQRENRVKLIVILFILTIFILVNVFEKPIIHALEPAAVWMRRTPAAWLIPIAILVVLSIPPLFGQEVVLMMIGVTWGPGIGMAVASAGTIIGELGTFYLFKLVLRNRAAKYEAKNIGYAVLARVIRDGGIKVAVVARYSIIPNHLLTALFSTCGMSLLVFLASAVLSLPSIFVNVYLGYALRLQADGHSTTASKVVNYTDIGLTIVITHLAARYMRKLQNDAKPNVIYERRKRRQADPFGSGSGPTAPEAVRLAHVHSTSFLERTSEESLLGGPNPEPSNKYAPVAASSV